MLSTAIFDQAADVLLYNQSFVIKAANVAEHWAALSFGQIS